VRDWAAHLAEHGLTVAAPRLPGHGTTWQELARTRWEDWYGEVERTFVELTDRCESVFAMGCRRGPHVPAAAQVHGEAVRGLVLETPSCRTRAADAVAARAAVRRTVRAGGGQRHRQAGPGRGRLHPGAVRALYSVTQLWKHVIPELPSLTRPTLLFRSQVDNVLGAAGAALLMDRIGSSDLEERVLADSHHVATLDFDAPAIFEGSLEFVRRLAPDAELAGGA